MCQKLSGLEQDRRADGQRFLWPAWRAALERSRSLLAACVALLFAAPPVLSGGVIFDTYSVYHHIQVVDQAGIRTLSFDGSMETRMSLANPLLGHFEYTEYFHMPWLWNSNIQRVLMIGLGGGSTQRAYQHYYTNVLVETAELDPQVVNVAKRFFGVTETDKHKIHSEDGRVFLRRSTETYDVIVMDAYTTSRYGSSLPPHLTTREFFALASQHLTTNGVLAYNVIGQIQGWRADVVGAMFRTLKAVFPQVYLFPANQSQNVVLIATKSAQPFDAQRLQHAANILSRSGRVRVPNLATRARAFINTPPVSSRQSPVLTDDHAPVESLMGIGPRTR